MVTELEELRPSTAGASFLNGKSEKDVREMKLKDGGQPHCSNSSLTLRSLRKQQRLSPNEPWATTGIPCECFVGNTLGN